MRQIGFEIDTVFYLGPFEITTTVVTTWFILLILLLLCWLLTRKLSERPGPLQTATEALIITIEKAVADVAPEQVKELAPFIGSLWIFLVINNLSGLIPGIHSPTRDLSATSALAVIVFLSVHW